DREAAARRGGRRGRHDDREPRRRVDLLPLHAPPEPGEEQAGARRPPPLPRTLPRADRGGPGGRRLLPRHTGRPRGRLPLRLRAPPVDLVPARRPAQPAGGRRPPRGPAPARPAPLTGPSARSDASATRPAARETRVLARPARAAPGGARRRPRRLPGARRRRLGAAARSL